MEKSSLKYLSKFVTKHKVELFNKVLEKRTRYITVALENIYQPHNASAVLRSCEAFGIQDIYIIENNNKYNVNPQVSLGSDKWLNLIKYNKNKNNSLNAINDLKNKNYRIVATTPHEKDTTIENFDMNKGKIALFFGNELEGLSDIVFNNADEFVKIPMFGFTESFNISVSAGIMLHHLTYKMKKKPINWQLTEKEKLNIKYSWLKKIVTKKKIKN